MSNKNTIIFRVECDRSGTALERSIILAQAHVRRGGVAYFAIHSGSTNANETLRSRGLKRILITAPVGSKEDRLQLLAQVRQRSASTVFIAGDFFDTTYLRETAQRVYTAVLLNNGKRVLPVQLVINPSFAADERFYTCRAETTLLLGPEYQVVDHELANWPKPERASEVPKVLRLFLGTGDDHHNARILDCMPLPRQPTVISVQGSIACPILNAAARAASARGYVVEQGATPQALLFSDAALTDSVSNVSLRGFYGIPSLSFSLDPEQDREVQRLAEEGANIHSPCIDELNNLELEAYIHTFVHDAQLRSRLGRRLSELVDGFGVERILDCVKDTQKTPIRILKAA